MHELDMCIYMERWRRQVACAWLRKAFVEKMRGAEYVIISRGRLEGRDALRCYSKTVAMLLLSFTWLPKNRPPDPRRQSGWGICRNSMAQGGCRYRYPGKFRIVDILPICLRGMSINWERTTKRQLWLAASGVVCLKTTRAIVWTCSTVYNSGYCACQWASTRAIVRFWALSCSGECVSPSYEVFRGIQHAIRYQNLLRWLHPAMPSTRGLHGRFASGAVPGCRWPTDNGTLLGTSLPVYFFPEAGFMLRPLVIPKSSMSGWAGLVPGKLVRGQSRDYRREAIFNEKDQVKEHSCMSSSL